MENAKKNVWKPIAIVSLCLLLIVSTCYGLGVGYKQNKSAKPASEVLSLWNDDAAAKKELTEYIEAVTKEGSADFIPVENRIAVFDLDGTLACETDPCYFDHCSYYYRVMEDPDYKDKASDFEKQVASEVKTFMETGESRPDSMERHGKAVASPFYLFSSKHPKNTISLLHSHRKSFSNRYSWK